MKETIKRLSFNLARSAFSAVLIGAVFQYFPFLLPVKLLYKDQSVLVFRHPVPCYPVHILVVPRQRIRSFMDLDLGDEKERAMIAALFQALSQMVKQEGLRFYQVVINGGINQDVPHLHFHLISYTGQENESGYNLPENTIPSSQMIFQTAALTAHPAPRRAQHDLIYSTVEMPGFSGWNDSNPRHVQALCDVLCLAQQKIKSDSLSAYTLLMETDQNTTESGLQYHLLSG